MFFRDLAFYWLPSKRELADSTLLDRRSREIFVEFMFAVAILGVLLALAVQNSQRLLGKIQMLEAAILMTTDRADAIAYKAATGHLPDHVLRGESKSKPLGRIFEHAQWRDDELVFTLTDRALERMDSPNRVTKSANAAVTLGFRVAVNSESGSLIWLCGSREAPAGFEAPIVRHTNVPAKFLPHFCRSSVPD